MNETKETSNALFSVRNVVRVLSIICVICFFCPSFLVSCSSVEVHVKASDMLAGYSDYDVKGSFWFAFLILLPIAVLVMTFVKNKFQTLIIEACSLLDFIGWIRFFTYVRGYVKDCQSYMNLTFKVTPWFVLDMLAHVLILVLVTAVLIKIFEWDTDLKAKFTSAKPAGDNVHMASPTAVADAPTADAHAAPQTPAFCTSCGGALEAGVLFCSSCGAKIEG